MIDVYVHVDDGVNVPLPPGEVERAVHYVLQQEGVADAEMSVAFLSDEEITELHARYLHQEGPTDVLAFALHSPGQRPLGDIYIGAQQAARQAQELGVPLAEELLRLVVHGTLHVLGYDHPVGPERETSIMYQRQEALLRGLRRSEPTDAPGAPRSELRAH